MLVLSVPGVEDTLKADLGFIYIASRVLEIVAPELARTSLSDIVADIRTSILEEVSEPDSRSATFV